MNKKEETQFFIRNLIRGLVWLTVLVVVYIFVKDRLDPDYLIWLRPVYDHPNAVYAIFAVSEILIGIIPPEIFMMWAASSNDIYAYAYSIALLSTISYLAGFIGYWIGIYFNTSKYYRFLKRRFLGKYEKYLNKFGGFLIIVAAVTPLPFSGIAMLMGSVRFSLKKYLLFSSLRFIRFTAYSFVIWEAHGL
ncbi:MAG: YqaA family protein [Candidatus Cyclobacteriaceae bacterium M3_2C_046]